MGSRRPGPPGGSVRRATPVATVATVVAAVALAGAAVAVHLSRVGWGLDRTDEGQYLLLVDHPETSRNTVFLAGYVLHPLSALLGGDIAGLRAVGILACVAVCAGLGLAVSRAVGADRPTTALITLVAAGFGAGPSLYFPLTPGYNTVAFWGVTLWTAGVALLADPPRACSPADPTSARRRLRVGRRLGDRVGPSRAVGRGSSARVHDAAATDAALAGAGASREAGAPLAPRAQMVGAALIGLGGVVAFAGKATSGAALAAATVVVVGVLVTARRDGRGRLAAVLVGGVLGAAVVTLTGLCLLVGHGPAWFVGFFADGARAVDLLGGHDRIVRLDPVAPAALFGPVAVTGAAALGSWLLASAFRARARGLAVAAGIAAAVAAIGLAARAGITTPLDLFAWWWLPPSALLAALLPGRRRVDTAADTPAGRDARAAATSDTGAGTTSDARAGATARLVLVVVAAAAPLAYAVGTNGNWWTSQARAAVFWVLAGVVALAGRPARQRALVAGSAVLLLALSVSDLGYGYRYAPPGAGVTTAVDPSGARLRLTPADAATTAALLRLSREHHLVGVPMIDTTGASPGYLRQLGGIPLGSTWLLGGYPGSTAAAVDALRSAPPADVARAWVLDAPRSPRRIPGMLEAFGRSATRDYEVVATFRSVLGYDVRLLRPRN